MVRYFLWQVFGLAKSGHRKGSYCIQYRRHLHLPFDYNIWT